MIIVSTKQINENKMNVHITKNKETIRKLSIIVGHEYIVTPLNSLKMKHRGRKVIVKGFAERKIKVQFSDNMKAGRVDISDLDTVENNLDK